MRRPIATAILLLLFTMSPAIAQNGLVAHWDFSEGKGAVLHDRSGNNNHGEIKGAEWVKNGECFAIRFDGVDDHVDCGNPASLDLKDKLTVSLWMRPGDPVRGGEAGVIGKAFGSYVMTLSSDTLFAYINGGGNNANHPVTGNVWNHVAQTFDGERVTLYLNGVPVHSREYKGKINSGGKFWIARSDGDLIWTQDAHFRGDMTDIRVYNRALSPSEIAEMYSSTNLSGTLDIGILPLAVERKIIVEINKRGLGQAGSNAVVDLQVVKAGKTVLKEELSRFDERGMGTAALDVRRLDTGEYTLRAVARNSSGNRVGVPGTVSLDWAAPEKFPNGPAGARRLNNLVTELLNVRKDDSGKVYSFVNPRDGWVFFSNKGAGEVTIKRSDSGRMQNIPLTTAYGGAREAMRELPAGKYSLHTPKAASLVVRAVPELIYAQYRANPVITRFGPFSGDFEKEHVFKHVNTLMAGSLGSDAFAAEWKARGGKWLLNCGVPREIDGEPVTVESAYDYLSKSAGFIDPNAAGSLADEFGGSEPLCAVYAEAARKLKASREHKGKLYYPFGGTIYNGPEGLDLMSAVMETGGMLAFERYLKEQPTETDALRFMYQALAVPIRTFEERLPGSSRNIVICYGYFSAPNETLDTFPHVNYRKYLDMQFHMAAIHPDFKNIGGLMTYLASYSDEEVVRWGARLMRHYAIEGKTQPFCDEPYELAHLENGDFEDKGAGWRLSASDSESIRFDRYSGFGNLQGRYPNPIEGDTVIVLKRSAVAPNRFSQQIRNLTPGKLYSLEMVSGDFRDMSVQQKHAVTVNLDGVTLIPEKCFTEVFKSCYSHVSGPYNAENPACMNYHWLVFRADGRTATLTVTDWESDTSPGGTIGQELMFNFVQVQPYFE